MGWVNCSILDYGTVWKKLALIFLYNFHHEHSLLKLVIKKVITENQCEKYKTIEFSISSWPVFFVLTKNLQGPGQKRKPCEKSVTTKKTVPDQSIQMAGPRLNP